MPLFGDEDELCGTAHETSWSNRREGFAPDPGRRCTVILRLSATIRAGSEESSATGRERRPIAWRDGRRWRGGFRLFLAELADAAKRAI
jgi:hypothetical protein